MQTIKKIAVNILEIRQKLLRIAEPKMFPAFRNNSRLYADYHFQEPSTHKETSFFQEVI